MSSQRSPRGGTIRVLLRTRSPVVRAGLESLILAAAALEVVDELQQDAEPENAAPQPDVIVADVQSRKDPEYFEALQEAANEVPVILLVRGPAVEWADALRQGVRAVLPNSITGPQLAAAIEAVAAGLAVIDSAEIETLVSPARQPIPGEILSEVLTAREIEVLRAMAEGLANKAIASRLGISEHTVKFHVASVMGKLGAGSRTEAVTLGIRHALVLI